MLNLYIQRISVHSKSAVETAKRCNYIQRQGSDGALILDAPGGYSFHLYDQDSDRTGVFVSVSIHEVLFV